MRKLDLDTMNFEELWLLHEAVARILADKINAEKQQLEKRLAQLIRPEQVIEASFTEWGTDRPPRRKYPKVEPKYCNPLVPSETWSGRGKRPRWLVAALEAGRTLEEFKIGKDEMAARCSP
jgi:DNA-binding protein H-NS